MKWLLPFLIALPLFSLDAQNELTVTSRLPVGTSLVPARAYPTYPLFERIMSELSARYPDRCRLEEWGTLPSGRRILALRLARGADVGARPRLLCSATMHGDETAGYWVLLRLAEDLIKNDPGGLLGKTDITIVPLSNPDGAFAAGNHTLAGARRGNSAGVDLNRNYPDPDDGRFPDGHAHQPETRIFMRAAERGGYDLAINLHGGAELFNYPWDTFRQRHADNAWWQRVSRDFARRAQQASGRSGYFRDRFNGVTNGHDWYPIAGSRQDYMNYYHRTREATVEISGDKRFPASGLPRLYQSLRPSLIGYLQEATFGIHGVVTDALTGEPLRAHIVIPEHDRQHSSVYSESGSGDFYRFLAPGSYRVIVRASGYREHSMLVRLRENERQFFRIALEREYISAPARRK